MVSALERYHLLLCYIHFITLPPISSLTSLTLSSLLHFPLRSSSLFPPLFSPFPPSLLSSPFLHPSPLPLLPLPSFSSSSLLYTFQYLVPDEPTNFTIATINSTALEASWGKPIDPNGIIEGYQLFLELVFIDASYLGNDSRMFNLSASDFSQTIGDLHPFATYRLDVRAITSVGPGNQTSQIVRTDEDGKLVGKQE